jgi:hypothetical protein
VVVISGVRPTSRSAGRRAVVTLAARSQVAFVRVPTIVAVAAVALLSASCAVLYSGTTQTVPVTSEPPRAEVFLDGRSQGLTPLVLELERGRDHTVVVRLGLRQRTFVLRSGVQTVPVVLDLVPVAVSGVAVASLAGSGFFVHALPDLEPVAWGLVAATLTPLLVDFGTGAMYQLTPGEVVVAFDAP